LEWWAVCVGVCKSGGVVVGLEPEEPGPRMGWMLKESEAEMVITASGQAGNFTSAAVKVVNVDERCGEVSEASTQEPQIWLRGESPACVVYRSGAAGRPIGVLIKHGGLWGGGLNGGTVERGEEGGERVAQPRGFRSEAGSLEVFRTLARGGCALNVPRALAQTP